MMNIKQCAKCNKLFRPTGTNPVCPECIRKNEEDFTNVRNFLYDHPNATTDEVTEATGVGADDINKWLREGRLILSSGSKIGIRCERCGRSIPMGRYCEDCNREMRMDLEAGARAMGGAVREEVQKPRLPKDEKSRGMHVDLFGKRDR